MLGTVYLLCFAEGGGLESRPGVYARHYVGWTEGSAEDRMALHVAGQGSPFVRAVVQAGQEVLLARTWKPADRYFERRVKKRKETPHYCPVCVAAGRATERPAPEPG